MTKNRKKITVLAVFIILLIFSCFYSVTVLQVLEGTHASRVLYQTVTAVDERFSIHWIHSVSKQPVIETYEINQDLTIGIYEMLFNENGPNLPAGPENGTLWEIKDGMFRVYNYSQVFDEVPVRIGSVIADHTLVYGKLVLPLQEVHEPGGFVRIRAARLSLTKYIYEEGKLWLTKKK